MFVIKRNQSCDEVNFNKVYTRIKHLVNEPYLLEHVNASMLAQKVIQNLYNNIKTSEIDDYTANLSASLSIEHINYGKLAGRLVISNCHKNTLDNFSDKLEILYNRSVNGIKSPLISDIFYNYVMKHKDIINSTINYNKDYEFDFFGFRTLEKGYLLKCDEKVVERPQDLYMRVAIFIHMKMDNQNTDNSDKQCLDRIFETYELLSDKYFIHATPTLFNSGTCNPSLASCFLLGTDDSLEGIMKTATDCANISKWAGGIGFHIGNWRSAGTTIRGTNGKSSGIVPFLRVFNDIARAFNQGGKRLGSFATYIEPHHPDIEGFLNLRKNHGDENLRARDLFLALWISDLFMKRVKSDSMWSLFDPDLCPGLTETYGDEYEKLYLQYETDGKASKTIRAREIWSLIFQSQKESGLPYMLYKDNVNKYNNQNNLGVIKSSNLCCEITIYSDSKEYGTCHLASICLSKFVIDTYTPDELKIEESKRRKLCNEFPINPKFDYKHLVKISEIVCRNLNNVIDRNLYPCPEAEKSSTRGRPIGIGVQGLADVFYKFKIPFESEAAKIINKKIFEAIYFGSLSMSTRLSRDIYRKAKSQTSEKIPKTIGAYPAYLENGGSHLANGKFMWELYDIPKENLSNMFDWDTLQNHINIFGVRNSLLTALMPTASTSHINGNIECFEPITSNMYKRKVLSGEFIIINKYLINDLTNMNLWNDDIINYLKISGGSIQNIDGLSDKFKSIYKTAWEVSQKSIMSLAVDRQPFVDQAQSMNLFFSDFNFNKFNQAQFYAWSNKLKTGSYYVRTKAAVGAQRFTVNPDIERKIENSISNGLRNTTSNNINSDETPPINSYDDNLDTYDDSLICTLCSS
jgi:ribonucleoside-diphosphate reductase alpha chain